MAAAPEHPRRPMLYVQILFEGERFFREEDEDEDELDDEAEGHSGKVEWLYGELHTTTTKGLKPVVDFRLHVSVFQCLYPCAHCGGRGEVERETGVVSCPVCYGEGADLLAEAGDVLQAVYWSWLRSAGSACGPPSWCGRGGPWCARTAGGSTWASRTGATGTGRPSHEPDVQRGLRHAGGVGP